MTEAKRKERIASLHREMDSVHEANNLYWEQMFHSHAAMAAYYLRQDRLEELRSELDLLRN